MIRIAAVGDIHFDRNSKGRLKPHLESLADKADLLLIAGDLTQSGSREEALAVAEDLRLARLPVITVLGNHDYHQGQEKAITEILTDARVIVLERSSAVFEFRGSTVGIHGLKGFGGGFFGACVTEFGEPETKHFAHHTKVQAEGLRRGLEALDTDFRFALLHFSPIEGTLLGEKREIYPFLGSYLFAEALDAAGADGVFHGHAHMGTERGLTPGGIPVRNVAQTVIRHSYKVYSFERPRNARTGARPMANHGVNAHPAAQGG